MLAISWIRDRRAVAAVEFAIASPLLFMMVAGTVDFGLLNDGRIKLYQAVSAGGYHAQLLGTAVTPSEIQAYVVGVSNLSNVTSTATKPACYCITGTSTAPVETPTACFTACPDGVTTSTYFMTISATYTYSALMPFWDNFAGSTVTASSTIQLQ